jgi:hypothetical protein
VNLDSLLSRAKTVSVILMCGAIAGSAVYGVHLLRPPSVSLVGTSQALTSTVNKTGDSVDEIKKLAAVLNRVDAKDPLHRTAIQEIIDNAAGISRMAYTATKAQQDYWARFPDEAQKTLGNVNGLVTKISGIVDAVGADVHQVLMALNADLKAITPVTESAKATLDELKTSIADLDALIKDPAVKDSLPQILAILTHTHEITAHVDGITGDAQTKLHAYLFDPPTKRAKFIAALELAYRILLLRSALTGL